MPVHNYKLTTWVEQNTEFIPLSDIEFEQIQSARANLFEVLFTEQTMDMVIETYLEWGNEILASSARHMVQWDFSYQLGSQMVEPPVRYCSYLLIQRKLG
jgi:hypothetical protein